MFSGHIKLPGGPDVCPDLTLLTVKTLRGFNYDLDKATKVKSYRWKDIFESNEPSFWANLVGDAVAQLDVGVPPVELGGL